MATAQMWKSSKFSIEREVAPGSITFRLSGPFTARDMYGTMTPIELREMFESVTRGEKPQVHVLDLTGVPYMDSAGLGMVAGQYARCHAEGVQMIALGVTPRVMEQFRITKLDTLISVVPLASATETPNIH